MNLITLSEAGSPLLPPPPVPDATDPVYVCLAGLTGAGKSTRMQGLAASLSALHQNVVAIDEKALHHPYVDCLFGDPRRYGLELQLQFMTNRLLFAKRWLDAGYSVLMERSHWEDPVFIRHLLASRHVTQEEHDTYVMTWESLDKRLRPPDAILWLEVPVEVALERLIRSSRSARRPPFPDHARQRDWITSWHDEYERRLAELLQDPPRAARIIRVPHNAEADAATFALESFLSTKE